MDDRLTGEASSLAADTDEGPGAAAAAEEYDWGCDEVVDGGWSRLHEDVRRALADRAAGLSGARCSVNLHSTIAFTSRTFAVRAT